MSIEIKITDVSNLTERELLRLTEYFLSLKHESQERSRTVAADILKGFPDLPVSARELVITGDKMRWEDPKPKTRAKPKVLSSLRHVMKNMLEPEGLPERLTGTAGQVFNVINMRWEDPKPKRKKQKRASDITVVTETIGPEIIESFTGEVTPPDLPGHAHEVTHEDLMAFVLGNIRERKISFDSVMSVVSRFNVPSLNSVSDFPHLIAPIYAAVKELLND